MKTRKPPALALFLLPVCATASAQDIVISELLARNESVLQDAELQTSDWFEVHNTTDAPQELGGWFITDDPDELAQWRIPEGVAVDPGGFLVLFASGRDMQTPGGELHTSFKLDGDGEYLALVEPDGTTVHVEYAPAYPLQFEDISFGLRQDRDINALVEAGAPARAVVPADGTLEGTWQEAGFDDSAWAEGTTGVGFDLDDDYTGLLGLDLEADMHAQNASAWVRIPFQADALEAVDRLLLRVQYDDGFVAYLNGREIARRNAPSSPDWSSSATAEHGEPRTAELLQDFDGGGTAPVLTAHGEDAPPRVLDGGPDGARLELLRDGVGNLSNTAGFPQVFGPAESVAARFDFRMPVEEGHTGCCGERADGFGFALCDTSVWGESGPGPTADNVVWERPRFPGVLAVGFDIFDGTGNENTVSLTWNGVEVAARRVDAFPLNAGTFHRCRASVVFDAGGAEVTVELTPDIFGAAGTPLAVFDGVRIDGATPFASRPAFGGRTGGAFVSVELDNIDVRWSTSASGEIEFEEIDVTEHAGALRDGENVLALHGLNRTASDPDFLLVPELEAYRTGAVRPGIFRYFPEPTPWQPNGDGYRGFAERPRFSRGPGAFSQSFDLELSVSDPETVVRYTTSRAEPTGSSPAYEAPIPISSTTVVKAKTFREGLLPGPTVTHGYVRLEGGARGFDSDLPIVILETFGRSIGEGSQTGVHSVFVDVDEQGRANVEDLPDFQGAGGAKLRGSSSLGFPKKQFAFETWDAFGDDEDVEILGFPAESDYILYAPYSDKSLMRNVLAYRWSNDTGRWAVRTRFVELFLNTDGDAVSSSDYHGLYVFMEKIKRSEERVDVAELLPTQSAEPEITGGYVIKKDRLDPGDNGFLTGRGQRLAWVEPKEREITPEQAQWFRAWMSSFENALYGPSFRDPEVGYEAFIDAGSFIDHHIITEALKNIDGYRLSTFWHKDRGGKLIMGPIWDYNLSLGNADYLEGWRPQGWYWPLINSDQYPYFPRLFEDPDFEQAWVDRWTELRRDELATDALLGDIDETADVIREAQARNFSRWPVLGNRVWPNWFIADTWQEEVEWMKGWLRSRLEWIDGQYTAPPRLSQDGGLIRPGFELRLSAPAGTVWYTLDGTDPRLPGGEPAPSAQVYGEAERTVLVSSGTTPAGRVLVPQDGAVDPVWTSPGFDDGGWATTSGGLGVGYENGSGYEAHIDHDVGSLLGGVRTSVYLRVGFEVADPSGLAALTLRMRYDDGFIAYLNGREIARANAPAGAGWDASATALHDDAQAVSFQRFDVSAHVDALRAGGNVLAVHSLNESAGSSDLLVEPRLEASGGFTGDPVVLDGPTHVVTRARDGDSDVWSGRTDGVFVLESELPLRISEIQYHPADPPAGSPYSGGPLEFLEMRNVGSRVVSLAGVRFNRGIDFDFTTGTVGELGPGEHVVIVRDLEAFDWYYGLAGRNVAGQYTGALDNGGEWLAVVDGTGETIHEFRYDDDWLPETDGGGRTLVVTDLGLDPDAWGDPAIWRASGVQDGTPGAAEDGGPLSGRRRPGDANGDGRVDVSDPIRVLQVLFGGGTAVLPCGGDDPAAGGNLEVLDANGDQGIDLSDSVHLLGWLFLEGPAPAGGTGCIRVEGCSTACE